MTLGDRLLAIIPKSGMPLRQLRYHFKEVAPGQLDAAIQGLITRGVFTLALGIVTAPFKTYFAAPAVPRSALPRTKKALTPEQVERRNERKRICDAQWRAKNRDKIRAYHRAYVPVWRAKRRAAAMSQAPA